MEYRKGICSICDKEDFIVKRSPSGNYCHKCNQARLSEGKEKKKYVYKRKPSGEMALFEVIWSVRKHVSFISGKPLGDQLKPIFFFHVLSKGAYPGYRLFDRNIVLTTEEEHILWHGGKTKAELLQIDPNWQKIISLEEELKQMYYGNLNKPLIELGS